MTVTIDLRVAGLLCSRLCHDLISPVGAINNGIELLTEMGVEDKEAMDLIAESGRTAARRLQFYRVAYGQATGMGDVQTLDEAHVLADGLFAGGRVELGWKTSISPGDSAGRWGLRLLLNLTALAGEALPRGGTVDVSVAGRKAGLTAQIAAEGSRAGLGEASAAALAGTVPVDELTPRTVQAYYVGCLCRQLTTTLAIDAETADSLVFKVTFPPGQ